MAKQAVRPVGVIELKIINCSVIVRPGNRCCGVLNGVWQKFAGSQILDSQKELFAAARVSGVSEQKMVPTNTQSAEMKIFPAFSQLVPIQKNFFWPFRRSRCPHFSAIDPVLFPSLGPIVIIVLVDLIRDRSVRFLDSAAHLLIKLLLQTSYRLHDRIPELVLGVEIFQCRGITSVA